MLLTPGAGPLPSLCGYLGKRDTEGISHALAASRVGFETIADVADLNLARRIPDGTGGVGKEERLFFR